MSFALSFAAASKMPVSMNARRCCGVSQEYATIHISELGAAKRYKTSRTNCSSVNCAANRASMPTAAAALTRASRRIFSAASFSAASFAASTSRWCSTKVPCTMNSRCSAASEPARNRAVRQRAAVPSAGPGTALPGPDPVGVPGKSRFRGSTTSSRWCPRDMPRSGLPQQRPPSLRGEVDLVHEVAFAEPQQFRGDHEADDSGRLRADLLRRLRHGSGWGRGRRSGSEHPGTHGRRGENDGDRESSNSGIPHRSHNEGISPVRRTLPIAVAGPAG